MKQVGPANGTVPSSIVAPVAREGVDLLLRLSLLLVLLRSPSVLLPLFWLRGIEMTVLGRRAIRSRGSQ